MNSPQVTAHESGPYKLELVNRARKTVNSCGGNCKSCWCAKLITAAYLGSSERQATSARCPANRHLSFTTTMLSRSQVAAKVDSERNGQSAPTPQCSELPMCIGSTDRGALVVEGVAHPATYLSLHRSCPRNSRSS